MKFCALIFLVYLAIGAVAGKKNKLCSKILDKLSDLEDLINKKQDCCVPGKVKKIVSVLFLRSPLRRSVDSEFWLDQKLLLT